VEREEFKFYYQPIVSMFNGEVTSLEALIRWKHPVHGLLSRTASSTWPRKPA
jgi:EAL domain-containing protein (putative c-di-GMP-specific phosphodiesterase class I)